MTQPKPEAGTVSPERTEQLLASHERQHRRWERAAPYLDVALGALVSLPQIAFAWRTGGALAWAVPLALVAGISITVRRRWPVAALVAATAAFAVAVAAHQQMGGILVAILICLFALAERSETKTALLAAAGTAAVVFVAVVAVRMHPWSDPGALIFLVLIALATALGNGVRFSRLLLSSMEQRARDAEASREAEAKRRVSEERVRIARELHDLVGHHVAVISIQSNVALAALPAHPDVAAEALGEVRSAAQDVLAETGAAVRLLRSGDEGDGIEAAAPGLARLPELLESLRADGVQLTMTVTGRRQDVGRVVDLTAYRIVQEALTNVTKHASRREADVIVHYGDGALLIVVTNPVGPVGTDDGGGYGLAGMRERAAAIGGTVHLERGHGAFRLRAELPMRSNEEDAP